MFWNMDKDHLSDAQLLKLTIVPCSKFINQTNTCMLCDEHTHLNDSYTSICVCGKTIHIHTNNKNCYFEQISCRQCGASLCFNNNCSTKCPFCSNVMCNNCVIPCGSCCKCGCGYCRHE